MFGRLEIDRGARAARIEGVARTLTGYQFDLLVALAERPGRVMAREALMDLVKGEALEAFDRSIDVHISRIRASIEDDPKLPRRIITFGAPAMYSPGRRIDRNDLQPSASPAIRHDFPGTVDCRGCDDRALAIGRAQK